MEMVDRRLRRWIVSGRDGPPTRVFAEFFRCCSLQKKRVYGSVIKNSRRLCLYELGYSCLCYGIYVYFRPHEVSLRETLGMND
jgi:hypothetical protein